MGSASGGNLHRNCRLDPVSGDLDRVSRPAGQADSPDRACGSAAADRRTLWRNHRAGAVWAADRSVLGSAPCAERRGDVRRGGAVVADRGPRGGRRGAHRRDREGGSQGSYFDYFPRRTGRHGAITLSFSALFSAFCGHLCFSFAHHLRSQSRARARKRTIGFA